jgi:hypothetical protein
MSGAGDVDVCANCGARLVGTFCAECGQKVAPSNPTARDLLHELATELLNVDNKIFRSLRLLFLRPGFLTRERFLGRRARYVSGLRLYLFFSVLFFTTLAFAPDIGQATYTPDPGEVIDPVAVAERTNAMLSTMNDVLNRWLPRAMFLLVPLFAAFAMLACRGRGRNYPQHLYFAFHVHAVAFGAGTLMTAARIAYVPVVSDVVTVGALLFAVVHFVLALHRAYETTWFGAVWRGALIGVLYLAVLVLTQIALIRYTMATLPLTP